MKKITFMFLLGLTITGYGQDKITTDTIAKKDHSSPFQIGFIGHINDNFNLNKKLASQNLPQLNGFLPGFAVGVNTFGKKISFDGLVSFLYNSPSRGGNKLIYTGGDIRLNFQYNVIKMHDVAFTAGASTAFTSNAFVLHTDGSTIDMNNLTPVNNPGLVMFYNSMFYMGPSAAVYLFHDKNKYSMKLTAGYEFALTRGHYHAYYGTSVLNNVGEAGNNRFVFGVMIL